MTVGFIGVGRLGFPLACALLDGGFEVVCTQRGRAEELAARGASIPGDGSPRAVAEAADVVVTCLRTFAELEEVAGGAHGVLAAASVPSLIELSTIAPADKQRIRDGFVARGADMLDAPVSGTPAMVDAKLAVAFASGERHEYERLAEVLQGMTPNVTYVGEFGTGTKMKLVAQFLGMVHVTATAEAMAYAKLAGLDLAQVAELISGSPGAMSGQFKIRAPLIAAGQFEGKLVTVGMAYKDIEEVISYGTGLGAPLALIRVAEDYYRELAAAGHTQADPAKLFESLIEGRLVEAE
jgi:3-hydroxyisobutyrate dehydrogenase-like beta-hydroxyacid dehydrogenase